MARLRADLQMMRIAHLQAQGPDVQDLVHELLSDRGQVEVDMELRTDICLVDLSSGHLP